MTTSKPGTLEPGSASEMSIVTARTLRHAVSL